MSRLPQSRRGFSHCFPSLMPDSDSLTKGQAVTVDLSPRGRGKKTGTYIKSLDDTFAHRVRVNGTVIDVTDSRITAD